MLRLLVDHDFNERILRGVQSRAEVDAVLARAVDLQDKPDAVLLAWAAAEDRIVLSHDLETMPRFVIARVRGGETMPGLISCSAGPSNRPRNRGINAGGAM